jgi:two-component system, sensor histidine kinase PhcS
VVDEAVRLASMKLDAPAKVRCEIAPGTPRVRASPTTLTQVLLNLLMNAADATRGKPDRAVAVIAGEANGRVEIRVEDNGPSISTETLPRLFEPFFAAQPSQTGTGLGLALSREYVQRFGGTLIAETRAEGGTRMVVALPAA